MPRDKLLKGLGQAVLYLSGFAAVYAAHMAGRRAQVAAGVGAALFMGVYGVFKKSLSGSGAMAAVAVGAGCMCPSLRLGMTLLAFFGSSSRLTSFKEELKDFDDQHRQGGQRDWQQLSRQH
eukprot:jgi/Astpho2/5360/Aster-05905